MEIEKKVVGRRGDCLSHLMESHRNDKIFAQVYAVCDDRTGPSTAESIPGCVQETGSRFELFVLMGTRLYSWYALSSA